MVGAGFLARRGELGLGGGRVDRLLFVEVKTRSSDSFGTPFDALDPRKQRALAAATAGYRALAEWRDPIRHAVVGVTATAAGRFEAQALEDPS